MSRVIFVAGPQGSGTSSVAGSLHLLGINMGERLLGKSNLNPKGHYECLDFFEIIRPLNDIENYSLTDIAVSLKAYTEKRNKDIIWGIKTSAIVYYIKYIIPYVDECRIVSIDRPFNACVKSSMLKYPEMSIEEIENMHHDIRRKREEVIDRYDIKNFNLNYNELTENPISFVKSISDFCFDGMDFPSQSKIDEAVAFVDPSLNHRREL